MNQAGASRGVEQGGVWVGGRGGIHAGKVGRQNARNLRFSVAPRWLHTCTAVWPSGMILVHGASGFGLNSQVSPSSIV